MISINGKTFFLINLEIIYLAKMKKMTAYLFIQIRGVVWKRLDACDGVFSQESSIIDV